MNTVEVPKLPSFDLESLPENIPEDLQNHIYNDYFLLKNDCDKVLKWLNENSSLNKNISEIYHIVSNLLNSSVAVEYLIKQNNDLKTSYNYHFIEDKKHFVLMNKVESFITSTLMYMWH